MRLPLFWLHEFCRPSLDAHALAERLAMTGTEVDRVLTHGVSGLEFFVVGRILAAEPHPNADRLRVCRVAVGEGDVAEIVCGAPNVAEGQTVAVAQPGAVMPDGTRLREAKLRGVRSHGMVLAEDELAIGTDHDGIMVLDDELVPGAPLADVLPIATDVLELEITANRPDCLGVYGVAREVHAATGAPLAPPPWAEDPGSDGELDGVEIVVEAPELCPRFTARVYEDVRLGPSPPWLKARLMAAGQRPISNVVDITNYVMLLTGQPLHAFDLDRVAGGRLVVRRAGDGERVETLDGSVRTLDPDMLLIADEEGPTSIAGVMGGVRSEVGADTTRVLMEAATWNGPNIQRTSNALGLRSEASARFEKQLGPEQALEAQAVAARLMEEVCDARLLPGTIDVGGAPVASAPIRLREARVAGLLGAPIPRARCAEILEALGFGVEDAADGLDVSVPPFRRGDVTREADLIEEVARIDGLERLPSTLPSRRGASGGLTAGQLVRRRAADALTGRGFHEVVGWSLADPALADRLRLDPADSRRRAVRIENPMAEDQSVLRTTLLGSLLETARHNLARGHDELRLFESGTVYFAGEAELPRERRHLAVLCRGPVRPPSWREPEPPATDFFAVKGVLEALCATLRKRPELAPAPEPFLHPGRAAAVSVEGTVVGWIGEIHPLVGEGWDLPPVSGFELDLDALAVAPAALYADVTSFPAVRQDLALTVAEEVPAGRVVAAARAASRLLASVEVFDVYRGAQVGEGKLSLALRLAFRAPDRTLTDKDAARERERILAKLRDELGAQPRV